jgi:hypothetical protein
VSVLSAGDDILLKWKAANLYEFPIRETARFVKLTEKNPPQASGLEPQW